MGKQRRATLKKYFEKGDYPTSGQLSDLVDSFINIEDDGIPSILYPKGNWALSTGYVYGDIVFYQGSSFYCLVDHTSSTLITPPALPTTENTYWKIFVQKGDKGDTGNQGIQGNPGEEIELQVAGGFIQWKYSGDSIWTNLISLASLTGAKGDKGDKGNTGNAGIDGTDGREIELQKSATHIQWRYVGVETWTDLILLSDLKGDQGNQGIQGEKGEKGIQFRGQYDTANDYVIDDIVSMESSNLGTFICIQANGHLDHKVPNQEPAYWSVFAPAGIQGVPGNDGTNGIDGLDITWKGVYDGDTTYVINDAVSYNGSSYICKLESTGNLPTDTTYWDLLAQKGNDGEGSGDMLASVYDPNNKQSDSFSMDNMVETSTKKILTVAERTAISTIASKADLVEGKVPASQLPSFVDDVLEYTNFASLPATGETGKIYVTLDDNKTYRWSGSGYVLISSSIALGETSATAYRGDRGKTAYDHSQASGNPHNATQDNIGDGINYKQYSATEKTKLAGIEAGATANAKATGAEADTGTDDAKFLTPKAAKDSHNIPTVIPGASGNVLKSNGTDWISESPSGGDPLLIPYGSSQLIFSDQTDYFLRPTPAGTGGSYPIELAYKGLAPANVIYRGGTKQSINAASLYASANNLGGGMIISNNLYVYVKGDAAKIFRCPISSDISVAGNWTEITSSGGNFPLSGAGFAGYGNNYFWILDGGNSRYIKYSLSGTVLTYVGTLAPTGVAYSLGKNIVNLDGIYNNFASAPYTRLSNFSGTFDTTLVPTSLNAAMLGLSHSLYANIVSDFLTKII